MTTHYDLDRQALEVNVSKASGPYWVPLELTAADPCGISGVLFSLALMCTGLVCKTFQWSGGRYEELYKHAGVQSAVASFARLFSMIIF